MNNTAGPREAPQTAPQSWLSDYAEKAGAYDEMVGADGQLREHWQTVASFVSARGKARCEALSERVQRRIVENGLTTDSFADPTALEQPWKLNLLPFVISESEWASLEAGLIQRMRLMEALLEDIYGAQTVMANGLLPASLIFNDPAFLRPLHGVATNTPRLLFMAVDLARDDSGNWHVLDTHAETIAGHGYALANRVVLADTCSGLFRDCNARRLSSFYQDVATECVRRSGTDDPTIAILGPDPDDATYLGHAYVARYMGYTLLEGSDLRCVGGKVWQKTLAGLQPIDLIVRAVDGSKADPLELDPSGFKGPAGFVQAVRDNPSLVANTLGTAIVENRGIAPYIQSISQELIGESLSLPDAPRLWLGDPTIRRDVFANISDYVVRPAFEGPARPGQADAGRAPSQMSPDELARLQDDLVLNGARFVADRPLNFATAPAWTSDGVKARPTAIRLFVAATGDGYTVMPGGLALTIASGAAVALSTSEAESHDIWISSNETQGPHYSRWRISEDEMQVQRLGARLPSRVADNLYWLGRYIERADWTLRVMRNALNRGDEDLRPIRRSDAAENAIDIIESKVVHPDEDPEKSAEDLPIEDRVAALLVEASNPYAIQPTFQSIKRLARQSRDRLSLDALRILSRLTEPGAMDGDTVDGSGDLVDRINERIAELAAFNGLSHENMTRNFGWRFSDIGRRMERALQAGELLKRLLATPDDENEPEVLAFLLETADSFMTYRGRYRFAPAFPLVLDLLMVDETNPRSIAYQLVRISDHLAELPKASQDAVRTPEQRHALELLTQIRLADLDKLRVVDESGTRSELVAKLGALISGLPELSDVISRRYFSLTEEQPHRVHTRLVP